MEDDKIVSLYLLRDESAISHTAEKYGSRLRGIAQRITGDAATAEECENDTYLEAWNRIPPHEPRSYLAAFLSRIVRNLSLNRCAERECLKRGAWVTEFTEELEQCIPASGDVGQELDGAELGRVISLFLHGQSKEKRVMFVRRYFYLDTIEAIAKGFRCSESKVKTRLFRMRKELCRYLEKEGYQLGLEKSYCIICRSWMRI